jgi:hypothetical protein
MTPHFTKGAFSGIFPHPLARRPSMRLMTFLLAMTVIPAVWAAFPAPAFAQDKVVQEADKTVFKKKTVIDFNDVTLEGDLTKPEGSYILNRKKTRFGSLIKLRDNFNDELRKSSDNL